MKLPALCVAHSGSDPVYHGGPSRELARWIKTVATKDDDTGKAFYRYGPHLHWIPLATLGDYTELNRIISTHRPTKIL
jgi:hypothetical protein